MTEEVWKDPSRGLVIVPVRAVPASGVRSHVGDGRVVVWHPGPLPPGTKVAVDAEVLARAVPPSLAAKHGTYDRATFWRRWTAVEVSCKLHDVPIALWLRRHGLAPAVDVRLSLHLLGDLVVSCGARRVSTPGVVGSP